MNSRTVGTAFAAEIDEILATTRAWNSASGIAGALLATEGRFVQLIEGERDDAEAIFARICRDGRHGDVEILASQFSDRPRFKDWSMAIVGDSPELRRHFADAPLAVLDFMADVARCPAETEQG